MEPRYRYKEICYEYRLHLMFWVYAEFKISKNRWRHLWTAPKYNIMSEVVQRDLPGKYLIWTHLNSESKISFLETH